jgi:triosephosphate isomerase
MRKPIIAGNWKCHKTSKEAVELVRQLRRALEALQGVEVIICPPFTALAAVAAQVDGSSLALGAQDLFWEPQGAFTGEVSAPMLVEVGCRYCLIGHSERRQHFGETDGQIHKKLVAALTHGLMPILCLGETLSQRMQGKTFEIVRSQVLGALQGLSARELQRLVIAYEPVWAIGTGHNATPAEAQDAQAFIRQCLKDVWNAEAAEAVRIQYGGSVTAENAATLLQQPDIDGALVGGASLTADSFVAIVKAAIDAKAVSR